MKILLVYANCAIGGIETQHLRLCKQLRKMGHDAQLYHFTNGPFADMVPPEIPVHFGPLPDLLELIANGCFDVVQGVVWDLHNGLDLVKTLTPAPKLVVTARGSICPGWTSKNVDAIVACASWLQPKAELLTDLPVRVIMNAIDLEAYPKYNGDYTGPPIVAWIGRAAHHKQKRIDRLAAIAPALRLAGVNVEVVSSDPLDSIQNEETRGSLSKHVSSWRALRPSEMPPFYRRVAASGGLVLMTSDWEGLPAVPNEAQASGCVVASTNVPGSNENVLPDKGGILFDRDLAPAELSELILKTLANPDSLRARTDTASAFVREAFSSERAASEYLNLYNEAPIKPYRAIPMRMHLSKLRHSKSRHARQAERELRETAVIRLNQLGQFKAAEKANKTIRHMFPPSWLPLPPLL